VDATIHLSNGKSLFGKVTLNQPIEFQDIFLRKYVSFTLPQVFRLFLVEEGITSRTPWQEADNKADGRVEKRYLMSVITWQGEQYWGRFACRLTLHEKYKKLVKFIIAPIQVNDNLKFSELYYVREVVCQPSQLSNVAKLQWLSLSGSVKAGKTFHHIFAVHHELAIVFPGSMDATGEIYEIPDIAPGIYDLFLVGDKEVWFAPLMPHRKNWFDLEVYNGDARLHNWLNAQEGNSCRRVLYHWGRQSDTRALVGDEVKLLEADGSYSWRRSLWLCFCAYHQERWHVKNFHLLYQHQGTEALPKLLLEPRLGNIGIPAETNGKKRYDYSWD
jgi:hypothetical protein